MGMELILEKGLSNPMKGTTGTDNSYHIFTVSDLRFQDLGP